MPAIMFDLCRSVELVSIIVTRPGMLTTVQDLGRFGFRRFGIGPGGAMDRTAARLINILLGNAENAAVLEMHFPASEITFEAVGVFAIGGASFTPFLDGVAIDNWRIYEARVGSSLKFHDKIAGNRAYLAVGGGFAVEQWLGSSATNLVAKIGGFHGRRLELGDRLPIGDSPSEISSRPRWISPSMTPRYSRFPTVRITRGAEFASLTAESKDLLATAKFTVTGDSDRMGFRLKGDDMSLIEPQEMLSSAVNFGTIQLLPSGQMVVLMADHQTTGGYPRVGHVVESDLPVLAQLGPGDSVAFEIIDQLDAEKLCIENERNIGVFRAGISVGR